MLAMYDLVMKMVAVPPTIAGALRAPAIAASASTAETVAEDKADHSLDAVTSGARGAGKPPRRGRAPVASVDYSIVVYLPVCRIFLLAVSSLSSLCPD
jgi:hypothetical protein